MKDMSLYIVSDLHISHAEDPLYHSLLNLLNNRAMKGDTVIFAGDIFDLFVGPKKIFKNRYVHFLRAVVAAGQRGVSLHYIEGNHDFLLQGVFSKKTGVQVYSQEFSIEIQGKRFFVAHGDLVDSRDYGYRALRLFFRSTLMKILVHVVPGSWLDWVGKMSSRKSRKSNSIGESGRSTQRMQVLRKLYRNFAAERLALGYDFVILGHCHDLDEMHFSLGGRPGQYINVGYPRLHGSFLSWTPGEEKIHREKLPDPSYC